ncbi:uncharacterized protein LOC141726389 isoform X14 [Zonotrichia albicollis]|uniref:uncharacterized protein LOC141726389 isoform X14 n=1 Tax=Zonotrichia albicollis TaxID=44394 RepID=UPI003D812235
MLGTEREGTLRLGDPKTGLGTPKATKWGGQNRGTLRAGTGRPLTVPPPPPPPAAAPGGRDRGPPQSPPESPESPFEVVPDRAAFDREFGPALAQIPEGRECHFPPSPRTGTATGSGRAALARPVPGSAAALEEVSRCVREMHSFTSELLSWHLVEPHHGGDGGGDIGDGGGDSGDGGGDGSEGDGGGRSGVNGVTGVTGAGSGVTGVIAMGKGATGVTTMGNGVTGVTAMGKGVTGVTTMGSNVTTVGKGVTGVTAMGNGATSAGNGVTGVTALGNDVIGVTAMGSDVTGVISMGKSVTSIGNGVTGVTAMGRGVTGVTRAGNGVTAMGSDVTGVTSMGKSVTSIGNGVTAVGSGVTGVTSTGSGISAIGNGVTGVTSTGNDVTSVTTVGKSVTGVTAVGNGFTGVTAVTGMGNGVAGGGIGSGLGGLGNGVTVTASGVTAVSGIRGDIGAPSGGTDADSSGDSDDTVIEEAPAEAPPAVPRDVPRDVPKDVPAVPAVPKDVPKDVPAVPAVPKDVPAVPVQEHLQELGEPPRPPPAGTLPRLAAVQELLFWRDVRKSAVAFGASLVLLLSLATLSAVTVLAHVALALLSVTISLRVYRAVVQALQKSDEGHPFRAYLDVDLALSPEAFQEHAAVVAQHVNRALRLLLHLFLVEDLVDSLELALTMWLMTYVGAVFNGITLLILADILAFTLPPLYEKYEVQINHYMALVRQQTKDLTAKIQAKLPGVAKKKPE